MTDEERWAFKRSELRRAQEMSGEFAGMVQRTSEEELIALLRDQGDTEISVYVGALMVCADCEHRIIDHDQVAFRCLLCGCDQSDRGLVSYGDTQLADLQHALSVLRRENVKDAMDAVVERLDRPGNRANGAGRSRSLVNPAPARGEPVGSYPPCRSDSACYRNDGHDGDHMYPNEPITYIPAEDMCPNCVTPWKCNGPHLRMSFDPIFEDQTPASAKPSDEA